MKSVKKYTTQEDIRDHAIDMIMNIIVLKEKNVLNFHQLKIAAKLLVNEIEEMIIKKKPK